MRPQAFGFTTFARDAILSARQRKLRERVEYFVNDSPFQLAQRALRTELSSKKTWVVLIALSLVVGVSGPFQTFAYFELWPRLLYWSFIVISTYCIGSLVSDMLEVILKRWAIWSRLLVTTLALSLTVAVFIGVANGVMLGVWPVDLWEWGQHFLRVIPICAAIVVGIHFFVDELEERSAPKILSRLPLEKRGALIALSVSDHYVNVMTSKGQFMVLMRLSDAIEEVAPTHGMQVHRSHWVATDQIERIERVGDRAACHMTSGDVIPVSRSYMSALRNADLLPRGRNG